MMTTTTIADDKQAQLIRDGYCVFEQVLTPEMLARVRDASDGLLAAQSAEHFDDQKSTGSMISVYDDPFFADLVAYAPALNALTALGYPNPRWSSGFVISKPGHSPPLFWHQDWWGWNDPISYTDVPQQLFLMYYLVDTRIENGCLRVIAGSHRKRHPMHDVVHTAHTDELRRATDPSHPVYQPIPEDQAVPVRAGDLVIGDSTAAPRLPRQPIGGAPHGHHALVPSQFRHSAAPHPGPPEQEPNAGIRLAAAGAGTRPAFGSHIQGDMKSRWSGIGRRETN